MGCVLCYKEERSYHNGKETIYKPGKDVTCYICSRCIQKILSLPQSELTKAYHKAMKSGQIEKAKNLEPFLEEKKGYDIETKRPQSSMVRERPLRKVGSSRY